MEETKRALEAVQHIYMCEDEGMASGQPSKEDYLEARELVAAALSELEGSKPRPEIAPECATAPVIRGVHERWHELGYNDQDRAEERFRGQPWKAFYAGWIEGRWPLMVGEGSKPKEPPRYVRSGPPVQMQDVLLACGELNERERVAVRWVLDKINELPAQPRYVMSGLAKEAMEVRHEFAAFVLDHYGITDHAELRTRIDSLLIMFDQLVAHPKDQGAEPVPLFQLLFDVSAVLTAMRTPVADGYTYASAAGTEKRIEAVHDRIVQRLMRRLWPPPPTSREKAMEEAGEEVIKAYRGFHEAIEQHTGKPYPWDPMVSAIEKWTTAKSTK